MWGHVVFPLLETSVSTFEDSVVQNMHQLIRRFCSWHTILVHISAANVQKLFWVALRRGEDYLILTLIKNFWPDPWNLMTSQITSYSSNFLQYWSMFVLQLMALGITVVKLFIRPPGLTWIVDWPEWHFWVTSGKVIQTNPPICNQYIRIDVNCRLTWNMHLFISTNLVKLRTNILPSYL